MNKHVFRLWLFVGVNACLWAVLPSFIRFSLPVDAMEGVTWAAHFQWGFDKDPYLNALLTRIVLFISGNHEISLYFLSQVAIAVTYVSLFQLFSRMHSRAFALACVLSLGVCQYYSLGSIDFDDNVLLLMCSALALDRFHRALRQPTLFAWLIWGICCGLGFMAKYSFALLYIPMLIEIVCNKSHRQKCFYPYFLLALLVSALIVLPHVIWLFQHDFSTIRYMFYRGRTQEGVIAHVVYAPYFLAEQLATFLPSAFLLMITLYTRGILSDADESTTQASLLESQRGYASRQSHCLIVSKKDKRFLWLLGTVPIAILVLFSHIKGAELHQMWGMPFLLLWPALCLLTFKRFELSEKRLNRLEISVFIVLILMAIAYSVTLTHQPKNSSANFPGKRLARELSQDWERCYHRPLRFVAGSRYEAGAVAYYAASKPAVFINWDKAVSPWIDLDDFREAGAIFIWQSSEFPPKDFTPFFWAHYPSLSLPQRETISPMRQVRSGDRLRLWIAFLPPKSAKACR